MLLKDKLTEDMKQAMKDKEAGKMRLSVIRMVRSAIRNLEIDHKKELNENEVLDVLAKEVKMRRDSLEEFKKGNRPDLVDSIEKEIEILMAYLPEQLNEDEVKKLVIQAIQDSNATNVKDMGKVMALLMPHTKGRADGKMVNTIVREMLNK